MSSSAALAGCTAPAQSVPDASSAPPAASSSADFEPDALPYPAGASADTPDCQPASSAALAAVNATIDNPLPGGADSVDSLTATPDPGHAVWLLTGSIASTASTDGYLISWATTSDPTGDDFAGPLRSLGGVTVTASSAPALQFTDVGGSGVPALALQCLGATPRDSSF